MTGTERSTRGYRLGQTRAVVTLFVLLSVVAMCATGLAAASTSTTLAGGATSGSTISGTVSSGAQDASLSGQAQVVLKQGGSVVDSTYSDASGNYAFDGVADGSYTVVATADKHRSSQQSVSVQGSDVTGVGFTLDARVVNTNAGTSYVSINNTVWNASSGDTITVAPGTYAENIDIGTSGITLEATGNASETIVDAASGDDSLLVTSQNVVVEGFTFRNSGASSAVALVNDGITIRDSIIDGNYLVGNGIYTNGGITVENVNISEANNFGINADSGSDGTVISDSEVTQNGNGILVEGALTIRNNTIANQNSSNDQGFGLWVSAGSNGTIVEDNVIVRNGGTAIQGQTSPGFNNINVGSTVVHNNNIASNGYGSFVASNGNLLDARYNWWGASDGPSDSGPGSGDGLSGDIEFDPFRTSANPGTPVIKGTVTSGAQDFAAGNGDISVQLRSGGSLVDTTTIAADGSYSFRNVSDGSYTVVAMANKHVTASAAVSVSGANVTQGFTLDGVVKNQRSGQSFVSISSAIDAGTYDVQAGDTIVVEPGTFAESVDFSAPSATATDLTIKSAGAASETVIDGQGSTPTINAPGGADGLAVEGFTLKPGGSAFVLFNTYGMNTVALNESILLSDSQDGVSTNASATIVDNEIRNTAQDKTGVLIRNDGGTGSTITGNLITGFGNGIKTTDADTLTIKRNQIEGNTFGGSGNGIGILVDNGNVDGSTINVSLNNIVNNNYGLYGETNTSTITAELNWWGSPDGPGTNGANGAGGAIDVEPWLGSAAPDGTAVPTIIDVTAADPIPSETGNAGTYGINFTYSQIGKSTAEYVSVDFGSTTADLSGVTTTDVSVEGPSGARSVEAVSTLDGKTLVLDLASGDVIDDPASGDQFNVTVGNVGNADDGTYTLTLGLHDDSGGSPAAAFVTNTSQYSVQDTTAPTADAGADFTVDEDTSFNFDGTASTDNGDSLTYDWDVDDDGSYEKSGSTASHTYAQPGTYTVTLRVTDSGGNTDTDLVNVTVNDVTAPTADASNSQTSGDEDTSFSFDGTASSDNVGIDTYEWDFDGDGTIDATGATASYTYADPGTYTATLTVTDAAGNSNTDSLTVTVNDVTPPNADAGSDFTVNEDTAFNFDGTATTDNGNIASYEWDVDGDGTYEKSGSTPSHTYNTPGTYTVTLRVTDGGGNTDTDLVNVTVNDVTSPNADAGSDKAAQQGETVTLDGSGSSDNVGIASYEWDTDDDGTYEQTGTTADVSYSSTGVYPVTLRVTDTSGNVGTDIVNVTVGDSEPPNADAGPDQTVDEDTSVSFDGSGSTDNTGVDTYEWDFTSDGTVDATGVTASTTYPDPGTYTVTLTATDANGNSDTDIANVTVQDTTAPTASAGADKTVDEDTSVSFDGSASSDNVGVTSYEWDFDGDGTTDATGATPTHTFADPGTYTVTLTVSDDAGNTDTDTLTVTVNDVTAPTADAGADKTVDEDTVFNFDGTASTDNDNIASYEWDVDGDGTYDKTGATASHTFADPGTYTVTLRVTDDAGNTDTDTLTVTVQDTTAPTADAGADKTVDEDTSVSFDGSASSDNVGVTSYEWDFDGDGTTDATGATPTHTFADPGTYTVTLTVSDAAGNTDTDTLTVTVNDVTAPTADAGADKTVDEDTSFNFDGTASTDNGNIASYEWDVDGDGTYDKTGATASHTFADPGTYTVTLRVTDGGGNTDTDTLTVTVQDTTAPTAAAGPDQTAAQNEAVNLDASGSSDNVAIASYEWDFDNDGTVDANGVTASTSYSTVGSYTVTLTVTDTAGNTATDTLTVTVGDSTPPVADAGSDTSTTEGMAIEFDATGSTDNVGIASYEWDFGDSSTATGPTPEHTYVDPGTYNVTLTVTDTAGNTATDHVLVEVSESGIEGDIEPPTAVAGSDRQASVGTTVSFDGSASSDNVGIVSYEWDVDGDGVTDATGATATHTYSSPGTYTVTLTVSDDAGNSDTDSLTVTVPDETAPTADAGPNQTVGVATPVEFNATRSADDGGIVGYSWDVDDDGTADLNGPLTTDTYDEPGEYTVTLTVTDAAGNTATDTLTVTVEDTTPPTAEAGADKTVDVGETVSVDATGSTDNVGIVSYEWDIDGDGTTDVSGPSPSAEAPGPGTYTGTLTVRDAAGNTDTDTLTITVREPEQTTTAQETETPDETGTPDDETETPDDETSTPDDQTVDDTSTEETTESSSGGGPGFTVVLALVALVAAALIAVHRR